MSVTCPLQVALRKAMYHSGTLQQNPTVMGGSRIFRMWLGWIYKPELLLLPLWQAQSKPCWRFILIQGQADTAKNVRRWDIGNVTQESSLGKWSRRQIGSSKSGGQILQGWCTLYQVMLNPENSTQQEKTNFRETGSQFSLVEGSSAIRCLNLFSLVLGFF